MAKNKKDKGKKTHYEARVIITLKHPRGMDEDFERVCKFRNSFHAVPGNFICICRTKSVGWYCAIIDDACGTPTYLRNCMMIDEIYSEIKFGTEEKDFPNVKRALRQLGWVKMKKGAQ